MDTPPPKKTELLQMMNDFVIVICINVRLYDLFKCNLI